MTFQDKVDTTESLAAMLQESKGAVVVDYRGLDVAAISALRLRLREQSVELHVTKNTLLRRAATASDLEDFEPLFVGPTAIATSSEDEVSAARLIAEAARIPRTPLSIKGGIYNSRGVSADDVLVIADLPSRDVMLARAVGTTQAPAATALGIIQAAIRQVLNLATALERQKEGVGG